MSETGHVACAQRRRQSLLDIAVALLIVIMVWPFPVMRALLSPAWHVAAMVATWVVITPLYHSISAAVWHRTLGMRAFGLRLADPVGGVPTRGAEAGWGIIAGAVALWYAIAPAPACRAGVPERLSGVRVVAVSADADVSEEETE